MQNQSKDSFPSDTRKNPKDCMAVTLRVAENWKRGELKRTLRKRNMQKLEKNLSSTVHKLLKKIK